MTFDWFRRPLTLRDKEQRLGLLERTSAKLPASSGTCIASKFGENTRALCAACLRKDHMVDQAFLEDLAPGQVFTSDARAIVDAGAIKRFAGEFDPQPFHLDEASARPTFFKKLVASGWHTTAVTMQLLVRTLPLSHGIIGTGVDELRWPRPVKPGDTLRVHCEVIEVTPSKLDPSRGIVRMRMTTLNQHDQPVQTMIGNLLVFRRPATAA
jgi:acyl dehydratase